jgi:hypothetical protein
MLWEWQSGKRSAVDEYRGWRKYRNASGSWPWWSVLNTIFVMPAFFAVATYGLIECLKTARLVIIYPGLFACVVIPALSWFGLRRLALMADVRRALQHQHSTVAAKQLTRDLE